MPNGGVQPIGDAAVVGVGVVGQSIALYFCAGRLQSRSCRGPLRRIFSGLSKPTAIRSARSKNEEW